MKVKVRKLSRVERVLRVIQRFDIDIKSQSSDGVITTWDSSRFMIDGCIATLIAAGLVSRDYISVKGSEFGEMFRVMTIQI